MRTHKIVFLASLLFFAFLANITIASHDDRTVRLRYMTGEVTLYPSDGNRSNEATPNAPILDGDEIETGNGRAELAFRNGVVARIGDYSAVRVTSTYSPISIELIDGTVFVDSGLVSSLRDELEVISGDAQIFMINEGTVRIDHGKQGSVRVTSIAGEAEVRSGGRRVLLEAGERTYVDPGSSPEQPELFSESYDELDDWNESRSRLYAGRYDDNRYVDESIYYDTSDLYGYGDWRTYQNFGYVWVPHTNVGWRPYFDGYWSYCHGGWFWVSYEPWGWAPYHYGRWGWSIQFGWYWIPGNIFAPSWVSWYPYGDYIGWCPLNYWNRPVIINNDYFNNHTNLPTVQKQKTLDVPGAWTFVKKEQIGTTNIKKMTLGVTEIKKIQIDEKGVRAQPDGQIVNYVLPKATNTPTPNGTRFTRDNDTATIKQHQDDSGTAKNQNGSGDSPVVGKTNPADIKQKQQDWERNRTHTATKETMDNPVKKQGWIETDRDNQFDHSKPDSGTHGNSGWTPTFKASPGKDGSTTEKKYNEPIEHKSKTQPWKDYTREDRDDQFQRNDNGLGSHDDWSPYYKSMPKGDRDSGDDNSPWMRDPKYDTPHATDDGKSNQEEITPRYSDDVKKIFEHYDWNNSKSGDSRSGSSDHKLNGKNLSHGSPKAGSPPPQKHGNSGSQSAPPPKKKQ